MKLSLSTFPYFRYPLTEAIRRIAGFGYDAVEIWGGRPHAFADDMDKTYIDEINNVVNGTGLKVSCFTPAQFRYPANLAAADKNMRLKSVDYLKRSIEIAAELNTPFVCISPGFSIYGQSLEDAWEAMIDSMNTLLVFAEDSHLTLLLEPGNRYETDLVVTIDDGLRAIKEVDGKLGIIPNTGHLFINKESLTDVAKKIKGIPCHYHISDNNGITNDNMVPGQGSMDYSIFLKELISTGYERYLTVELGFQYTIDPDLAVKQSIEFLRRHT
jgi:protein FrlC